MPKLTLFFSGTDMTWEDTALFLQLGASKRHNLRDKDAKHYYYFFDGPAAASSPEHLPTDYLEFDEKSPDFVKTEKTRGTSTLEHFYDMGHGTGMDHIIRAGYQIIKLAIKQGITEFDFVGFSRGGSIALAEGALIKKLAEDKDNFAKEVLDKIKVNIIAIDPVAGFSRNKSANVYGDVSGYVKNCIVGLATNESLPGFAPRDILSNNSAYNLKFNPATKYIFLPFPEDHLMCHLWMQDIVKKYIPVDSPLASLCDETLLIERRLGLKEFKWDSHVGDTSAYRMVRYVEDKNSKDPKHKPRYSRHIFPCDEKKIVNLKQGVEEFFKYLSTQHMRTNVGHVSLQNDADSEVQNRIYTKADGTQVKVTHAFPFFKKFQMFSANFNDRTVKKKLSLYTNTLFVNLLHEALFAKAYPSLHRFLLQRSADDLSSAQQEYETITFPFTQVYIRQVLQNHTPLKPISALQSSNLKNLGEVFAIATNSPIEDMSCQPQQACRSKLQPA